MADIWTSLEIGVLVQSVAEDKRYNEISLLLGRTAEACRKKSSALGLRHHKKGGLTPFRSVGTLLERLHVPDLAVQNYTKLVHEVEGNVAVACCVHCPETDPVMWERLLAIGARDNLNGLIIAGDLIVADMFSHWPADGVAEGWGWDKELLSVRNHLETALEVFEFIYILPGNHVGNRVVRTTNGHIKLANIITMSGLSDADRDRIITTDLDYMTLISGGEKFLAAHATNYSVRGGNVPTDYAEKYEAHVIVGNGHITGTQHTKSGKYFGFEIGTMADPETMAYAQRALTKFPKMQKSFATVIDGAVKIYGDKKPLTDWLAEIGVE